MADDKTPTLEELRKAWSFSHTCGPTAKGPRYCIYCALHVALSLAAEAQEDRERLNWLEYFLRPDMDADDRDGRLYGAFDEGHRALIEIENFDQVIGESESIRSAIDAARGKPGA